MNLLRNIEGHLKPRPASFPGRTPRWLKSFHSTDFQLDCKVNQFESHFQKCLIFHAINVLLFILKQQLSSGTAIRTPTSAKKPLLLLNLPSTGGPERVCTEHYPPLSSSSSFFFFPDISVLIHLHSSRGSCLFL